MALNDAFGAAFQVGTAQVETAIIVGTGNSASTLDVTFTASGMTGSPILDNVTIVTNDTAADLAQKVATQMNADSNITALFRIETSGPNLIATRLVAIANDGTMNIAYTGGGTTPDASSNDTTAGVVVATVAQVTNIGGPGLSADTIDVTTHDSTNAWEESVIGILRSGEVSLDLVYDPADNTQDFTDSAGLGTKLKNRTRAAFSLVFPDSGSSTFSFDGEVTGFEPGSPVEGALTAAITIKITGSPILV